MEREWSLLCASVWLRSANGLMQDMLAVFSALVGLTRRQSFLPVYPRSVRKLPPAAWVYFSKPRRMQVIVELKGKNLFFRFSLLFFSLHIGLLPLTPKELDKIPLCIFLIPTPILMKPSPPTEESPVPGWRWRDRLHTNLSHLSFREMAVVSDKYAPPFNKITVRHRTP